MNGLVEWHELFAGFFIEFVAFDGFQTLEADGRKPDAALDRERDFRWGLGFQKGGGFDSGEGIRGAL